MTIEAKDLKNGLDKAWSMKLEDQSLNFNDEFIVAPQVTIGTSIWAKWLKEKRIRPYDVLWAFKDTNPKQWLAIRINLELEGFKFSYKSKDDFENENTFYFNLQTKIDRLRLNQLEKEVSSFLMRSQKE